MDSPERVKDQLPEDRLHEDRPAGASPSRAMVWLLAAACGISVANLYYAQPLLHSIARSFGVGAGRAGLLITFSQIGYAIGLALLVPLGDMVERRRLCAVMGIATAVVLAASAVAPSANVLIGLALLTGIGSVIAQILVPLAASLASEQERGRVVGTVMGGLLVGILLGRTVAGLMASAVGWRSVYWLAAALMTVMAAVLYRALPAEGERPETEGYRALLASTAAVFFAEPLLRRRALYGALGFAAFSVFWTTAAFLLAGPPYHYGDAVIGLFGLVGAAGALCAGVAGRLADRGWAHWSTLGFGAFLAVAFVPLAVGAHSLAWLIIGIVILDIGVQGLQVTNQSLIYQLRADIGSRVNAAYMVMYLIGGGIGSAVGSTVYGADGWRGVCVTGGGIGLAAVILWMVDAARPVPAPHAEPAAAAT